MSKKEKVVKKWVLELDYSVYLRVKKGEAIVLNYDEKKKTVVLTDPDTYIAKCFGSV